VLSPAGIFPLAFFSVSQLSLSPSLALDSSKPAETERTVVTSLEEYNSIAIG